MSPAPRTSLTAGSRDAIARSGRNVGEIHETLIIDDIRAAAELLAPVYRQTEGRDGSARKSLADFVAPKETGLRDYVGKQATDAQVPDARRVRVTPLGQTQTETAVRGPKPAFAFIDASGDARVVNGAMGGDDFEQAARDLLG